MPGTVIPAGQPDIPASFTYRLAFDNAGQQFGLAGAITLIIFLVVAAISYANFVAILSGLPITIVFLIAQRYLVKGLSDGAVKGQAALPDRPVTLCRS